VPEVPVVPGLGGLVAAAFASGGALAGALADFEPRAGQVEMAAAVARALEKGGVLLAEAGTGTGKTLAYLVPAIYSRRRVLISTGTKNLQEQIVFKDIPVLREALGVPFSATYMKGRGNYLCLHRLERLTGESGLPGLPLARPELADDVFLRLIAEWAKRTETGDRAELEDLPEDLPFWNEVAATAETCLGAECPKYEECFVTRMRRRAAESDIVVVNHHLLCADAAVRQGAYGEVIPACHCAIVDEAHQLEDVVTQYFGFSVSAHRVETLARDVERFAGSGAIEGSPHREAAERAAAGLRTAARAFFAELALAHGAGPGTSQRPGYARRADQRIRATGASLAETIDTAADLAGAIDIVERTLVSGTAPRLAEGENPAEPEDARALAVRARELRDELRFLLRADDPAYVYFVEVRGRGIFLRAAPVDVSGIVREVLFDRMQSTVLTSATLSVDGAFDYIRDRLGIGGAEEVRLPSEFDFARQAVLYLPPRMPDPRSPDFIAAAGREVVEILKCTRGRAFVLFTSYASLRAVHAIAELALEYPILVQGTAPRTRLLQQFRETAQAVLFATASFWQGVDVAGEALSCVIVDKLPFASPDDPITSARIDAIRRRGGAPFDEYQVPLAILALQQGLGRLIRHRRDRGVLAVLDPRLRTRRYGARFLGSLPPAPVVHDLGAVEAFLAIV
jgi:ATP-dependent DNA helicase DinG